MRKKNQIEDLTGQRFGLLTVIGQAPKVELECEIRTAWQVQCNCGIKEIVIARYLKRGSKETCGARACKRAWENSPNHPANVEY
jgi:hypothetical protein